MRRLLSLISQGLGLKKDRLREMLGDKPRLVSQANYYPPCPQPELTLGLPAHTDLNALTVLMQSEDVTGLQVMTKDGEWIAVNPLANAFVVNIGDQIQVLSNGRYKSVHHRAITNKDLERVSIAMFYGPNKDIVVGPVEELVDQEHPPMYRSYRYLEHQAVGEAIVEALERELVNSREELFITCKLPYHDAGPDVVVQNLRKFLEKMHLDYVDLCLVQQPEEDEPERANNDTPLTDLMFLKEKELRELCLANNISIIACSTIGGEEKQSDFTQFMELEALQKTAKDRTKTADQVVCADGHMSKEHLCLLESLSKEHMLEILNIFEWSSSQDD
ncbi:UNVERIFIED_CONTAM: protein DMR6-LIKE OXYGENASE 2 [Sesamum radiatum]|uniref:Protein DMR6-LIKE OXYGENASE 2 n=1 Tax=Sesamum radiatum TaxID=300843 RepID=A0AAW2IMT9_SESRA